MTITVPNGQDIIDIVSDGFVTCLKIRKPDDNNRLVRLELVLFNFA